MKQTRSLEKQRAGQKYEINLNQRPFLGSFYLSLDELEKLVDLIFVTCCVKCFAKPHRGRVFVSADRESSYGDDAADPSLHKSDLTEPHVDELGEAGREVIIRPGHNEGATEHQFTSLGF